MPRTKINYTSNHVYSSIIIFVSFIFAVTAAFGMQEHRIIGRAKIQEKRLFTAPKAVP